ncbi:MAG TPA: BMP family protein [Gemmatimonadaceae bacterium]|nr:BMP family protein [Gemmatimonadaceae bacterium]
MFAFCRKSLSPFEIAWRMSPLSLLLALAGVLASACHESQRGPRDFKVALLTPGPISDKSWNASAYMGLERIRDSLGATVSHIQVRTPGDFEENFRQYGAAGYALVIGHGFEFQDAAARVAPEYPKTVFVTTGGDTVRANVAPLAFAFDEPAYLAGMAAGALTGSGIVACVGGTELPPVKSAFSAFTAGARAIRPGIQVITAYIGNWDDVSAGREQALALARRGADVVFQDADAAGLGVFQAAREGRGIRVIGSNANQNDLAPNQTIGSVVVDIPHAFLRVARDVRAGTFIARVVRLTTRDDVVRWEPNPALLDSIPAAARAAMDTVQRAMRAGSFTLPAGAR